MMEDKAFGFEVKEKKVMNAEETRSLIMSDIKSYWGEKCLVSSAPFILTLQ